MLRYLAQVAEPRVEARDDAALARIRGQARPGAGAGGLRRSGAADRIKESAWELLELIDGSLGYARYEGENPDLRVEVLRPEDIVTDAVSVFRSSMREKGARTGGRAPA